LLDALLKVNGSNLQPEHREETSVNPVSRRLADISKARRLLGFEPSVGLEAGLEELSDWYFARKKAEGAP
jgi:UDP-glucose 4-epimerase